MFCFPRQLPGSRAAQAARPRQLPHTKPPPQKTPQLKGEINFQLYVVFILVQKKLNCYLCFFRLSKNIKTTI